MSEFEGEHEETMEPIDEAKSRQTLVDSIEERIATLRRLALNELDEKRVDAQRIETAGKILTALSSAADEMGIDLKNTQPIGSIMTPTEKTKLVTDLATVIPDGIDELFFYKKGGLVAEKDVENLEKNLEENSYWTACFGEELQKTLRGKLSIHDWGDLMGYTEQALATKLLPFIEKIMKEDGDTTEYPHLYKAAMGEAHQVLDTFKAIFQFEASAPIDKSVVALYEASKKKKPTKRKK